MDGKPLAGARGYADPAEISRGVPGALRMNVAVDAWLGAALPVAVVGLLLTAGFAGSTAGHGRVTREGGTFFLPARVMHTGYAWIDLLARAAGRRGRPAAAGSWR